MPLLPPDRWPEIEALFSAATEAGPDQARQLLEAADPSLAAEVERLLRRHSDPEGFLDGPSGLSTLLADAATAGPFRDDDLARGSRVGPWQIEEEIGRGGMGTVYRARRADGLFEQTVALKVVRRGLDSAGVVRRFERERALVAGLRHPGIAALIDGGTAPDGRPYLALEVVDGEPITRYADAHRLGLRDRARLVISVAEAVAHAHRRLVVHRDLKPSNVLVATVDGRPVVKLLDFGVAALLDGDDPLATQTADGPRPLTPEYAAPEQLDGRPVTTTADVYALGVLLYELLAGRRPGPSGRLAPTTLPPSRASAGGAELEGAAAARSTSPDGLRRALRGDLDAVCLKALRPEPDARYASADALADDLRRWLDGQPVEARRGSRRYVAGKFARRHRAAIATAAVVAVLVGAFGAHGLAQRRAAAVERERAELASSFVLDLLAETDPREGAGGATPIRDVLARAERRAEAELAARPDLLARVLLTVGSALTEVEAYDRAERPLRRALALALAVPEGDAMGVVEAHIELAGWARRQGRHADAEREARAAVLAATELPRTSRGDLLRARALGERAALDADRGRFTDAVGGYRPALGLLRRAFPGGHRQTALLLSQFGGVLSDLGDLGGSAQALREAATMQRRLLGPAHPELAFTYVSLGNTLELRDSLDAAVAAHRRALTALRAAYDTDHWATAMALHNLASAEDAAGRDSLGVRLYREALAMKRRLYGDEHGSVAATLINLGYLQFETGDVAGAEATTRDALRVTRAVYDESHYRTAIAAYNLAEILLARRRLLADAEHLAAEALRIDSHVYGTDDEGTLLDALLLGRIQAARGACHRAVPTLRETLDAFGEETGSTPDRRAAERALASCRM